jgi:hypothetical protein
MQCWLIYLFLLFAIERHVLSLSLNAILVDLLVFYFLLLMDGPVKLCQPQMAMQK